MDWACDQFWFLLTLPLFTCTHTHTHGKRMKHCNLVNNTHSRSQNWNVVENINLFFPVPLFHCIAQQLVSKALNSVSLHSTKCSHKNTGTCLLVCAVAVAAAWNYPNAKNFLIDSMPCHWFCGSISALIASFWSLDVGGGATFLPTLFPPPAVEFARLDDHFFGLFLTESPECSECLETTTSN